MFQPRIWLLSLLILVPVLLRVVDHPWNLAPVAALALFVGTYFRDRTWAILVPLAVMVVSDVAIGMIRHNMEFYTFHKLTPLVYGCYVLNVCLGFWIRGHWNRNSKRSLGTQNTTIAPGTPSETSSAKRLVQKYVPVAGAALTGSVLFYLITNFGDWLLFYERSWTGLMACYVAAIPFFKPTLAGDVFYVVVFFGGYELVKHRLPVLEKTGLVHAE